MEKEFIVGQWYKGEDSGDYYMKFMYRDKNENLYFDEKVNQGRYKNNKDYWANDEFEQYALEYGPVSAEEISPYLPDGHPDKIQPETLLITIL